MKLQCEPFLEPVNTKEFPDYLDYVFHPMDISTLEKSIKKKTYGSTQVSSIISLFIYTGMLVLFFLNFVTHKYQVYIENIVQIRKKIFVW